MSSLRRHCRTFGVKPFFEVPLAYLDDPEERRRHVAANERARGGIPAIMNGQSPWASKPVLLRRQRGRMDPEVSLP